MEPAMTLTVQQIIDTILAEVPGAPLAETVDTLKAGRLDAPVRKVVTTFIATLDVLRRSAAAGADLVITHEPTYFNHFDKTDWLGDDPVYAAKKRFIEESGLAIWRFHDHWHMHQPDGIITGLAQLLGWEAYHVPGSWYLFEIPPTPLAELVMTVKEKLGVPQVRVVGPAEMTCRRVATVVGAAPGEWHIESMGRLDADTVLCGEVSEWQVYEYARDSLAAGIPRALIAAGHERTEEPGMAYLATWLKERLPELEVVHIPAGDPQTIR
jgi:putative NIF3 family GTP cyclohydrolase 1 type 2